MREADQYTIAKGTPSKELMRRAAQGVFDAYPGWATAKTLIVCGPGNNGGDGYALAAIMKDKDLDVTVLRVSEKFSEDGAFYYNLCKEKGFVVDEYKEYLDQFAFLVFRNTYHMRELTSSIGLMRRELYLRTSASS